MRNRHDACRPIDNRPEEIVIAAFDDAGVHAATHRELDAVGRLGVGYPGCVIGRFGIDGHFASLRLLPGAD